VGRVTFSIVGLMLVFVLNTLSASPASAADDRYAEFRTLAASFFQWRKSQQPVSGDDIPRVERPDGWVPDWSPEAIQRYREQSALYLARLDRFDTDEWTVPQQVDARLLRAAIQRVNWELNILRSPHRNPLFYVQQTLGSVFELLIISSPMDARRAENIILRLEHIPETLKHARENLDESVRPFAQATIATLEGIEDRLLETEKGLQQVIPNDFNKDLHSAVSKANKSLKRYSRWLESNLDDMRVSFAIGPDAYAWFLSNVALIPYTPNELLLQGRQDWSRSVAWDVLEQNKNREQPQLPIFPGMDRQIAVSDLKEREIRAFLESHDLMSVPDWLTHYRSRPSPDYLTPLSFLGVNDDLTSETRLDEDAYRYITEPSADLPYFQLSAARDPRPLIIHEGVPGHFYQMALSWAGENPIRRRYIDSSVNEGIAFYVEEMLLQAGLFDFSPKSKEIIYSYARLRALRVEIDIRLAVGDFTIEDAARYLARAVPMDEETARDEAVFFAFNPGQAITYQIGKLQILHFLADAKLDMGNEFSLRHFHDSLMLNGNVPIALQRWEYLGRKDSVHRLDALGGEKATVPQ
jgi:hypothetical protein